MTATSSNPMTLAPCPFCGSRHAELRFDEYHVECLDCGARGPEGITPAKAIKGWNTRRAPSGDGDGKHRNPS